MRERRKGGGGGIRLLNERRGMAGQWMGLRGRMRGRHAQLPLWRSTAAGITSPWISALVAAHAHFVAHSDAHAERSWTLALCRRTSRRPSSATPPAGACSE